MVTYFSCKLPLNDIESGSISTISSSVKSYFIFPLSRYHTVSPHTQKRKKKTEIMFYAPPPPPPLQISSQIDLFVWPVATKPLHHWNSFGLSGGPPSQYGISSNRNIGIGVSRKELDFLTQNVAKAAKFEYSSISLQCIKEHVEVLFSKSKSREQKQNKCNSLKRY